MFSVGVLFFILIASIIFIAAFVAIKTALDYLHPQKPVTLKTNLNVFKESYTVDNHIKRNGHKLSKSTTSLFEDKCVINPTDEVELGDIIERYRLVLNGEILDPEGKNAPSEFIGKERNPDYLKYLINQKEALTKRGVPIDWFSSEINRVSNENEYSSIKEGFITTLINEYRFPSELVSFAVIDSRMEDFNEKQWKELAQCAKRYITNFSYEVVSSFLFMVDSFNILVDYEAMEKFNVWLKHDVPFGVILENLTGRITDEEVMKTLRLVDLEAYSWDEAMKEIIEESFALLKEQELRRKYREMVERR